MSTAVEALASAVARPRTGRRTWIIPLLAVALTATAAVLSIQPWPVGVFQDDGIYAILGKAIASGHGYRYLNLPGAPAATHYPPAYPLVLALLWRLAPAFPANAALFVFTNVAFLALAALGVWSFGRRRLDLGPGLMLAVVLATVACMPVLSFSVYVLSEPMFMAATIPVLLVAEHAVDGESRRHALAAGFLTGCLAMVRTMGEFAVVALILVLLWRRRWIQALLAALGASLLLIPWQTWVALHAGDIPPLLVGKYGSYGGWFAAAIAVHGPAFVLQIFWKNLVQAHHLAWEMFGAADAVRGVLRQALAAMLSFALATAFVLGSRPFRRRAPVTWSFVLLYSGIVMLWPFEPVRFLWAILPLFGFLLVLGGQRALRWHPASPRLAAVPAISGGVIALLLAGYGAYNISSTRQAPWQAGLQATAERAASLATWARAYTRPDDLLATDDDPLIHLYTGRRTIPVGTFTPEEYLVPQTYDFAASQLEVLLHDYRPRYIMCSTSYCTMAARSLSERTPPLVRFLGALERGAVFEPVAP